VEAFYGFGPVWFRQPEVDDGDYWLPDLRTSTPQDFQKQRIPAGKYQGLPEDM
jgi:hypothetical protein